MGNKIFKVKVNSKCIGCGTCANICPAVFEVEDGYSVPDNSAINESNIEQVEDAIASCPSGAIEKIEE